MAITSMFLTFSLLSMLAISARGQLSTTYYATSCPNVESIVQAAMASAVDREIRMGASILRMHFHDCFVNGCDGSILLKDTSTFTGEQNVIANKNSIRGYEVIDTIKAKVEAACSATVSCADILALAARDGTVLLGGPTWTVQLGRRDATTTTSGATSSLAAPSDDLITLVKNFGDLGLNARDMTALSGSHTIGQARCTSFRAHIYNDTNIDPTFATKLQANCPLVSTPANDNNLAPLEFQTPNRFGNDYFKNLVNKQGVLHSDQELFNNNAQDSLVQQYSTNTPAFLSDFAAAMVKMSNIKPLTGTNGEVRLNCGQHN